MDAPTDDRYSRAPEVEDLLALCRSLNASGAKYLLVGGFAVILHGAVRGTKDIDLLIADDLDNVRRVKQALGTLPDNAVALMADSDVATYQVVRVADEIVVDLMARACGIDYAEAVARGIEQRVVDDVEIPLATKALLIAMKQTFRPSDQSDVIFLQRLLAAESEADNES